jgi:HAD superfamily hydrolase (TIGR01509 family)
MAFAYIFDFDGVLVNTMEAHFQCYKKALGEAGVPIDKKQFFRQAGMTAREQIKYFCDRARKKIDIEKIYKRKKDLFEIYIESNEPIECNLKLLALLKKAGVPVAIATGSSLSSVIPVIKKFNIKADVIATSEDVAKGKPNPDLFLCAARKLNVPPCDCIVVEDSEVGIEAAARAGMKSMRFFNTKKEDLCLKQVI